ncbi:cysteine--tRNA ligase [Candidatus Blochmannia ocreatus (nom. nud.)]|uniref:Cysteine--tRNA ligase n=1 Tax=Candidatus Blochmannia ocreatus (nom. nud.) TaxID=251538 RepID=A0ABY4SWK1_9ENTR|nr:cysteine--tRNA ligase [Candidatus Blochmannia ocreatus]URJ25365.1 cysteine--tRNA ligase [Candidatus Blochmannia ocreatus]
MLKIFNTLTKKKEKIVPITHGKINIYVCGVTTYDLCHIGHARTFIIFDIIIRYLRHCGYQINYTRNITDIDDKIIKKSQENHETITQFTARMITEMHIDLDALNILRPNHEPKVTEYIDDIITFIGQLIKKKHAYISPNGDVIFSLKNISNYGILSNLRNTSYKTNNTFKKSIFKKNPMDFVLWKTSKLNEPRWASPWGFGRPGWHIECSAINYAIFGTKLDIHGGGSDLIFPHHDNEIAQSESIYHSPYAKTWIHTGMLLINKEKMSKSLNNVFTIRDILKRYNSETIRFFLLSAHYRSQLKYDEQNLKNAHKSLKHLYIALQNTNPALQPIGGENFIEQFISAINDDFNTPAAYSVLFKIANKLNNLKTQKHPLTHGLASTLKYLANIIGLLYQKPEIFLQQNTFIKKNRYEKIQKLIQYREYARKNNQWKLADRIRNILNNLGIRLEDNNTGKTKWYFDKR